jgi:cell division septation protein DedD
VVSAPAHTRSRAGLVFGCIALLGGGLVALLLLNVSLERGSYVLQDGQTKQTRLQDQAQALREQLAALQAPQNLAAQASKLGMVPNPNAAFLRASDGRVLGVPTRAVAPKPPTVTPAPGTTAAAKPGTPTPATSKPTKTTGAKKPDPTPTH